MTEARLTLGRLGEDAAANYLKRQKMKILERNYSTPVGEIDLIVRDGRYLVFVEVKTRSGVGYGSPAEAVGLRKQRQIVRTAKWYLNDAGDRGLQPRFDVVAVIVQGNELLIDHIPAAFDS